MSDMVGMVELAKRLGLDRTSVRRLVAKEQNALGITLHRGKGEKLSVSREDADRLIASYESRRGPVADYEIHSKPDALNDTDTPTYDRHGYLYLIQLVPEALPNRVKVGFTDDVDRRLSEHRTAAPTAKIVRSWPCKRSWDYAAMDSITRTGCQLVLNEVYDGDVQGFIERAEAFFNLMPDPESERELSEHSPLHEVNSPDDTAEEPANAAGPTSR